MTTKIEIKKIKNDFGQLLVEEIVTPVQYLPLYDFDSSPLVQEVLVDDHQVGVLETYYQGEKIERACFKTRLDIINDIVVEYITEESK